MHHIPSFPLDISIAAYYVKNTQMTFEQYLEKISSYSQNFEKSQQNLLKETSNYTKTRYGIITSSLEKMIEVNSDFKELLLFICLLDSQNIPKEFLNLYQDNSSANSFIYNLKKYSLITSESSDMFSLHRNTQTLGQAFLLDLLNENDKKIVMNKIIAKAKALSYLHREEKPEAIVSLIPHLDALAKNLERINLPKSLKEQYEANLSLLTGHAHYKYAYNIKTAKKYLIKAYTMNNIKPYIPNRMLPSLLKDLGDIYAVFGCFDESLFFCKESIKKLEKIPNSEILIAENLIIIGYVYQLTNNFKEAKRCLKAALNKIYTLDKELKRKIEAEIYAELATLYSITYLNRKETFKAEKYALKALEIFNASELLSNSLHKKSLKISCYIAKLRMVLGRVYNRLGKYDKAMTQGFKEAEYVLEHSLNKCFNPLLKAMIRFDKGEVFLRSGQLNAAEKELTESIRIREKLVGKIDTVKTRIYRIETRIRLRKFTEAYEDCTSVFNIGQKIRNHYFDLMYLTCFYHAALIKYKQGDLPKSLEHFADFFKGMKLFCQSFLDEKEYKDLEEKGVFVESFYAKDQLKDNIAQCLHHSATIFSAIYGPSHPFVHDYVLENCRGLK